jgi:predicted nucleic acid-binding protein
MITIDATVLADFFVGEEKEKNAAKALFLEDSAWIAPSLWQYELPSALKKYVQRVENPLPTEVAISYLRDARLMVVETVHEIDPQEVLRLALERSLTPYDASYVWLAMQRGLKFRTRDKEVLRNCPDVALPMPGLVR